MKQVKTLFNGWCDVTDEQYEAWCSNIRKGATALTNEQKEKMIKERTRKTSDEVIVCPFWVRVYRDPLKIRCSYIESDHRKVSEYLDLQFPNKQDKQEQIAKYCATYNYMECPNYKKLISKMEKQ
jgi:hypothetical protein